MFSKIVWNIIKTCFVNQIHTKNNPLSVISYNDTEAITRIPDNYNYTENNRLMSMDNGDDVGDESRMFSRPRQAGAASV